MDWKQYEEMPPEGIYEKIREKMRARKIGRRWAVTIAGALVIGTAMVVLIPQRESVEEGMNETYETASVRIENVEAEGEKEREVLPIGEKKKEEKQEVRIDLAELMPETNPTEREIRIEEEEEELIDIHRTELAQVPNMIVREKAERKQEREEQEEEESEIEESKVSGGEQVDAHVDDILWAPNILAAEDEDYRNRVFKIKATSPIKNFRVQIYNKRGMLIYVSNNIEEEWDATYNGRKVQQGAYVWVATYTDESGRKCRQSGTVTVVR